MRRADRRPSHTTPFVRAFQLFIFAWGAFALTSTSLSAQIGIGGSGLRTNLPLRSMKDLRDENMVKQRFDFSCGAAALATVLHYGFGEDINERQVLIGLFDGLSDDDKRKTERTVFSLLDLKRVARASG